MQAVQLPAIRSILWVVVVLALGLLAGLMVAGQIPEVSIGVGVGICVFVVAFVRPEAGLYLLIFSMLLSPEMVVGRPGGELVTRGITLRLDDFLILILGFGWFARAAVYKELGLFTRTPLNLQIFTYLFLVSLATAWGVLFDHVESPGIGFLFILKYFEYFVVFFMVANYVREFREIKRLTIALLAVSAIVSVIAILQIPGGGRVTAPFEGVKGEPNTLGGYLILMLAITGGLLLHSDSWKERVPLLALITLMFVPFIYTLSRTSYFALVPMILTVLLLVRKRVVVLGALAVVLIASPVLVPDVALERVRTTVSGRSDFFRPTSPTVFGGYRLDPSAAARLSSLKSSLRDFPGHLILGYGVTGYEFLDVQYARTLLETGILGFVALLWLLWALLRVTLRAWRKTEDPFAKGLTGGFLAGIVGLVFHALGANTFIIVRIMEPFWVLAGISVILSEIPAMKLRAVSEDASSELDLSS